jgi:histidine triad (HIT) family protein
MNQSSEDLKNIREKLTEQIKGQYDEPQANEFISKINSMKDTEFTEFLKNQGLISEDGENPSQCIFCSMVKNQIPTTKISENNSAIAILELNPITQGHTLIIPKKHVSSDTQLDKETLKISEEIIQKLTNAFSPKKIELIPSEIMGHQIINVLPIYNDETLDSPRINQTPEDLALIKEQIENSKIEQITLPEKEKIIEEIEEPKEEINEENTWLPKRIP